MPQGSNSPHHDTYSRCASVVSTTSISGQFCQVNINNQPVIVPKEYLTFGSDGRMSCAMSGVQFPVSTCVDVDLEQGPPDSSSESLSESGMSLVVPSSSSTTSAFTLDEGKMYTVSTSGQRYQLLGRDIVRGAEEDDSYFVRINGALVEVSDIEDEGDDMTEQDVSIYSMAPGFSDSQELQPTQSYDVIFNGRSVNLPGSMFYPTDVPGNYIVSVNGQTGLVQDPQPALGYGNVSPFTNISPFTDTTLSSRNSTPRAVHFQPNPEYRTKSPTQQTGNSFPMHPTVNTTVVRNGSPQLSETFQVEGITQERFGSPTCFSSQRFVEQESPRPNYVQEVPSFVTQLMVDALERTEQGNVGFEVLEMECQQIPAKSILKQPSPKNHIPRSRKSPKPKILSPKQHIIKEQLKKAEHIVATAPKPRKPKFISPLTYLPQVQTRQKTTTTRVQFTARDLANQIAQESSNRVRTTVSFSSSSDGGAVTPDILPTLPGLDVLFSKFMTIAVIHQEAFVEPVDDELETTPRPSSPFEVIEDNVLVELPGMSDLNERVRAEIETESRLQMTREDFSSDSDQVSDPGQIYDKVVQLSHLPGLATLDVMVREHVQNVERTLVRGQDSPEQDDSLQLYNLPGIDGLLEEADRPKGLFGEVDCEETDTALFHSMSIGINEQAIRNRRMRGVSGSSVNTIQQIDDIMSLNSSIKENNSSPVRRRTPSSQVLSPDIPRVDFYRVLIDGAWYTAKSSELSEKNGDVYMTMVDRSIQKVERFVKVPGVASPSTNIYLCDSKIYSVHYNNKIFIVSGTDINPSHHDFDRFDVLIDGQIVSIKPANITEKEKPKSEFGFLKSMVAIKLDGVWKIIPSTKLAPSAKMVGQYYVKRNGKIIFISPQEVYPMFKDAELPLGTNNVPSTYIVKLKGRHVKVPIGSFAVSRSQNDSVIIHHKSSKQTVKLSSLSPFLSSTPQGSSPNTAKQPFSSTNTSSFSAPEYKDNLYRVNIGNKSVNIAGRHIKPHKTRNGFCKMRYRGKIYRVKSTKIKLARQTATCLNDTDADIRNSASRTSIRSSQASNIAKTDEVSSIQQDIIFSIQEEKVFRTQPIATCVISKPVSPAPAPAKPISKYKPSVRFPNFSQLLKTVPAELPFRQGRPRDKAKPTAASNLQSEHYNVDTCVEQHNTSFNRQEQQTIFQTATQNHPAPKRHPHHPITLDAIPRRNLKIVTPKEATYSSTVHPAKIHETPVLTINQHSNPSHFEISNIRSSPTPPGKHFEISNIRPSPTFAKKQFEISNIQASPLQPLHPTTQQTTQIGISVNQTFTVPGGIQPSTKLPTKRFQITPVSQVQHGARHTNYAQQPIPNGLQPVGRIPTNEFHQPLQVGQFQLSNVTRSSIPDEQARCVVRATPSPNRLVLNCDAVADLPLDSKLGQQQCDKQITGGHYKNSVNCQRNVSYTNNQAGNSSTAFNGQSKIGTSSGGRSMVNVGGQVSLARSHKDCNIRVI